jgi:hypothetical protein
MVMLAIDFSAVIGLALILLLMRRARRPPHIGV